MSGGWSPLAADLLPGALAQWLASTDGAVRVAVDGPPCASPEMLAEGLLEPLRALGRPAAHVRAVDFWHDASLRLEYGRHDVESYRSWVDADALRREVLDAAVERSEYLPSLRDPATNRSTREPVRSLAPDWVLIVSGSLLLGQGLRFDRSVHLFLPADARARLTPEVDLWTLPAFDDYDADVQPTELADVLIRPDRRPPIVRGIAG